MASESDGLVGDLAAGQAINRLRPDQRRAIEEAIAEMSRPVRVSTVTEHADHYGIADSRETQAPAVKGQRRSDAEPLLRDGARHRDADWRNSDTLAKAHRDIREATARADAGAAETRAMQRDGVCATPRDLLATALATFHAGGLTAHHGRDNRSPCAPGRSDGGGADPISRVPMISGELDAAFTKLAAAAEAGRLLLAEAIEESPMSDAMRVELTAAYACIRDRQDRLRASLARSEGDRALEAERAARQIGSTSASRLPDRLAGLAIPKRLSSKADHR